MFVMRIIAGTLLFALLAMGCNSDEEPVPDVPGLKPIELDNVDGLDDPAKEDRHVVIIPLEVINPLYKPLLDVNNQLDITGRSVDELLELIGEPMSMIRQGQRGSEWHKEVWILPIYQKDSTGLYIYIENNRVTDWRLDTFVGIGSHPQLIEWFRSG